VNPAKQAPVLFASAAHPGQLNPLLAIAGELSRRGVPDLWFCSEDDAAGPVAAAATGSELRFVSTGERKLYADTSRYAALTRGPRTTHGLVALLRVTHDPALTAEQYPRVLALIDRIRPRLMAVDTLHLPALDAATTRGVPYVLSVPFPVTGQYATGLPWRFPTPTSGLPLRMSRRQQAANVAYRLRLQAAVLTRTGLLRSLRRRRALGIANAAGDPLRYNAAAAAVFGYSVFGLEYPFDAPDTLHLLGAMVPPRTAGTGELPAWLDRHPSVVYVGLGSMTALSDPQLRALSAALAALGPDHHVLWKLPAGQHARLPAPPPHVRLTDWLPSQLDVLAHPHVRAFVTHGGSNGFHEGIYFGQPLLVLPFWLDCYDSAVRAVDAGVGLTVDHPPRLDATELTAKLRRLLTDDTFRTRSRYWGDRLRAAGGVARAADLVLAHRDA
jgi:UDP:flavonoid glycosyltransferase YjiC (YdhE family)